mmetsp:Transcript_92039/g.297923  ORF Transcript_92039/g.297923 Transcript_92039/m.297923 type:complete len:202 (-) Transcript_92039:1076-1681(-)
MVHVRPHSLRQHAHGPRADLPVLRHPAQSADALLRLRGQVPDQHHRHRRQDHPAVQAEEAVQRLLHRGRGHGPGRRAEDRGPGRGLCRQKAGSQGPQGTRGAGGRCDGQGQAGVREEQAGVRDPAAGARPEARPAQRVEEQGGGRGGLQDLTAGGGQGSAHGQARQGEGPHGHGPLHLRCARPPLREGVLRGHGRHGRAPA